MGAGTASLFDFRLRELGLAPETVREMPLVGRLLSLWKLYGQEVEREGPRHFGDRFLSINFNSFCRSPDSEIGKVYERLGAAAPSFDFSGIHPPPAAFDPLARQWKEFFDALQIDKEWLADAQRT